MLLPSLLKSGDQVYQKVIKQLYQKMLLLNLLITHISRQLVQKVSQHIFYIPGRKRRTPRNLTTDHIHSNHSVEHRLTVEFTRFIGFLRIFSVERFLLS